MLPNSQQLVWPVDDASYFKGENDPAVTPMILDGYGFAAGFADYTSDPWLFGSDSGIGTLASTHTTPRSVPERPTTQALPQHGTGEGISSADMLALQECCFDGMSRTLPWLNRDRLGGEMSSSSPFSRDSPPLLSLRYAIALMGCTLSPKHSHLEDRCYRLARAYAEACESDGQVETHLTDINLFQSLLLLARYESCSSRSPLRAWMTVGRLSRLSRILGLQRIDRGGEDAAPSSVLASRTPPLDAVALEERRRCFWAFYMVCYARAPCLYTMPWLR